MSLYTIGMTKNPTMIHKTTLLSIVFILCAFGLNAQDIHFSQFYTSPLNLNPAMTGLINAGQRVTVNYRNQWAGALGSAAYNTYSASYDRKLAIGQEDYFGVGGTLWSDVAGETSFGSTQARLSASFSKKIAGNKKQSHFVSFGADVGITQRRVRTGDFRWLTQVNGNAEFDPSQGAAEAIPNTNITYPDVSGGLMWFSNLGDRKNVFGGVALHHLNQPNVSFLNSDELLFSRLTAHLGGEYPINRKVSVKPNFIYLKQGPHTELNGGGSVRFKTGSQNSAFSNDFGQFFELGLWYRVGTEITGGVHSDAVIVAARLDYDVYGIGLSYDYNVSGLSASSPGNGSFELSLSYLFGDVSGGVFCPVF